MALDNLFRRSGYCAFPRNVATRSRFPNGGTHSNSFVKIHCNIPRYPLAEIGNLCIGRIQVTGARPRKGPPFGFLCLIKHRFNKCTHWDSPPIVTSLIVRYAERGRIHSYSLVQLLCSVTTATFAATGKCTCAITTQIWRDPVRWAVAFRIPLFNFAVI